MMFSYASVSNDLCYYIYIYKKGKCLASLIPRIIHPIEYFYTVKILEVILKTLYHTKSRLNIQSRTIERTFSFLSGLTGGRIINKLLHSNTNTYVVSLQTEQILKTFW